MGERRALLIGAQDYGAGFDSLPAVVHDLALMEAALRARGFKPERVANETVRNAANLASKISDFCQACKEGDIHIVYFTGHGISMGEEDWFVPAGVNRDDARSLRNLRVPTDYSSVVENQSTGLVLFLIDACRNRPDFEGADWGRGKRAVPTSRFIRFLGCGSGQVCWVLKQGHERQDISVFTKALADVLMYGWDTTLLGVLEATRKRCEELWTANRQKLRDSQEPRLDLGEIEDAMVHEALIFPRREVAAVFQAEDSWPEEPFDPAKLHCLVISSEQEPFYPRNPRTLEMTVRRSLIGTKGERVWKRFQKYWQERQLVGGSTRPLPETYHRDQVRWAHRPLLYWLESPERLELAARALTEADLVVFDVTGFEPGIMLLMGIRSAARRGVSISSHGGGWKEGTPLPIPFGLQDLNLNCHTATAELGSSATVDRLVERICNGFDQMRRQPSYLDLPAYDSLRRLGSDYAKSGTIGLRGSRRASPAAEDERGEVLVLCSYSKDYSRQSWSKLETSITDAIEITCNAMPRVRRMIDLATPQLISQSLFERLRRVEACLVDWTDYKEAVFLELGIRLAASPWGAVQIVEKRCLPGQSHAPRWRLPELTGEHGAEAVNGATTPEAVALSQAQLMKQVFSPIPYKLDDEAPFTEVADHFATRDPHRDKEPLYARVYRAVAAAAGRVSEQAPPVHSLLIASADALQHPDQEQISAPQILFHDNPALKRDSERASLERRLAAWFYLHYRLSASATNHPLRRTWAELGKSVAGGLYDSGKEDDLDLALEIEELVATRNTQDTDGKE